MIRIMIADDHRIVRQGLKQFIELAPDLAVVGEAANGQELQSMLSANGCDVLLLDMTMPGVSGIDLIKRIRLAESPPLILVLSMHNEGQLVSRALKAGAAGYITKDIDPEALLAAIYKVAKGGRYIDPSLVDSIVFNHGRNDHYLPHEQLSDREYQIFLMLVSGKSITSIAGDLSLSVKTISTHKLRLMRKMQMQSIAELTRYALENRLVQH